MKQGTSSSPRPSAPATPPATAPAERTGVLTGADTGFDKGMKVLSYLLGGVAFYGGLGWLADHLLGTMFLLPLGIVLGAGLGVFVIIRRFGSPTDAVLATRKRRLVRPSQEYVIRRIPR